MRRARNNLLHIRTDARLQADLNAGMKTFLAMVLLGALSLFQAPVHAQPRYYNQAELDALLAPIALYPDPLLSQVLMAATYPADVSEAAAWSRANPHLKGEDAVRAAQGEPWDPGVKSLLAFPDVLARMDESPQWLTDLGQAFLVQEPQVMETVQELRRRAQASGYLPNERTLVQQEGSNIAIYPAQRYVYAPYYDPLLVYGPWWWPAYQPVYWRPWHPAPVFVSTTFFFGAMDWHRRHVAVVRRPAFVHVNPVHVSPGKWRHVEHRRVSSVPAHVVVPEAKRQPIVRPQPTFGVRAPGTQTQPTFGVRAPRTQSGSSSTPVTIRNHVQQAQVARSVAPAVQVQPGFERREIRHERREARHEGRDTRPAGASPNSARLSSIRGKPDADRDAGRRHQSGAGGNAPHSRRSH